MDLSRLNSGDLALAGLGPDAAARLTPFLGLTGDAAVSALAAYAAASGPLVVGASDAGALEQAMAARTVAGLDSALREAGRAFGVLSSGLQTAIADLAYQYGPDIPSYSPILWGLIRAGQWALLAAELMGFQGPWAARRRAEAALVLRSLETGPLAQRIVRVWDRIGHDYLLWFQPLARRGSLLRHVYLPAPIWPSYLLAGYLEGTPGVGEFLL